MTIDQQNQSYLKIEKFKIIMPIQIRDSSIFNDSRFKIQIINDEYDEDSKLVIIIPKNEGGKPE